MRAALNPGRSASGGGPSEQRVSSGARPLLPSLRPRQSAPAGRSGADEARDAGADDALLLTAGGLVAEGTTWNVFWWEWQHLCTPALELGVLPGVARSRIATLAPLEEGRFARGALEGRSVFLANAVRGVVPVAALDSAPVPTDPRTEDLARRFWPALSLPHFGGPLTFRVG